MPDLPSLVAMRATAKNFHSPVRFDVPPTRCGRPARARPVGPRATVKEAKTVSDLAISPGQDPVASHNSIVEVPLLLPGWQAARLEQAAAEQGLTTGQLARRLIRDFLRQPRSDEPRKLADGAATGPV